MAQVAEKWNEQNKIRLNWLKKQTTNQIREKKQTSNHNRERRLIDSSFSYPHLRPCVEPTRRSNQIARNSRTWLDVCFDWQLEIPVASFERSDWSFALFWFFRAIWLVVCFFSQLSRILFCSFHFFSHLSRVSFTSSLLLWIWNLSSILIPYLRNNKKKSKSCQSNELISRFWKIKFNDGQIRRGNRMATILKLLFICGYENSRFLMQDRRPKHVLHGCDEPTGYLLAWSSLS